MYLSNKRESPDKEKRDICKYKNYLLMRKARMGTIEDLIIERYNCDKCNGYNAKCDKYEP